MAQIGIVKNLKASHGSEPHQHIFKIEFLFEGNLEGDFVANIDFHDIISKIDELLKTLENKYLPSVEGIGRGTCENLVCYLFKSLKISNLEHITIWEDIDRFVAINKQEVK